MTVRTTFALMSSAGAAWLARTLLLTLALTLSSAAEAQDSGGDADIELGATQASSVELGASSSARSTNNASSSSVDTDSSSRGDTRLVLQLRLDAINLLALAEPDDLDSGAQPSRQLLVPLATPGVRLLDDGALFLGVGFGFANADIEMGPNESSQFGFSISPLVSYDVLTDDEAALSLVGLVDLASLGETEQCNGGGCMDQNDDAFGIGIGLGVGLRGKLTPGVAIGGEFGWGFLSISRDGPNEDDFVHGIFANLLFEASIGL